MHSPSGFASGVNGMTPGFCRAAQAFITCREAKSRKRYESMLISTPIDSLLQVALDDRQNRLLRENRL